MKKIAIYEPAMCCPTGLCGVGVDPELLRISTVVNNLKNRGIVIERYNLNSAPQEFVTNKTANEFINSSGVEGLPITVIDGEIWIKGRYPTNDELSKLFNIPVNYISAKPKAMRFNVKKSGGCNCSGGNCC